MSFFTICGTTRTKTAQPCAIVDAISSDEALRIVEEMRRNGDLAFLPIEVHFTARRSSRQEAASFAEFIRIKPLNTTAVGADEGYSARIRRLTLAYYQKLWRGKVKFGARAVGADAGAGPGSGGTQPIRSLLSPTEERETEQSRRDETSEPSQQNTPPGTARGG